MKPIIIITGPPQSYTSLVSKFLLDNGGYSEDLMGDPNEVLNYERFESKNLEDFIKQKKWFKKGDLTDFFASLPADQVITLKMPFIVQFLDELKNFTDREIRIVYAIRNPQDTILSSIKKSGWSFIYFFERLSWYHNFIAHTRLPVFALITEQLLLKNEHTARQLLSFCSLEKTEINFTGIDHGKVVHRKPTYIQYRFANFLWKRLSRFFRVFNDVEK
ncbi:MAG: hypothetical protein KDC09_11830 [Bacteroidales bacterium]|nr:hypothetical protein [Bacteroidales bacterium]